MMKIRKPDFKKYAMLLLGAAILSFGLFQVHSQSKITEGGVLGMTLLVNHWTGIPAGLISFILDMACYIMGVKYLGKQFLKYAIVASCGFAVFYSIHEKIGYILPDLTEYPLLAAVAGGIFVGVGAGLIVRSGGASGGDDALALVISQKSGCNIAKAYFFSDAAVLLLSLSYIPLTNVAGSLLTVTISSFLIGRVYGLGKKKALCTGQ